MPVAAKVHIFEREVSGYRDLFTGDRAQQGAVVADAEGDGGARSCAATDLP
jgi:hypothetical protein